MEEEKLNRRIVVEKALPNQKKDSSAFLNFLLILLLVAIVFGVLEKLGYIDFVDFI